MMTKRRCIGCNEEKSTNEMYKITKDFATNEILINPDKYKFGRSAYICKSETCINSAFKKNKLSKFLKIILTKDENEKIKTVLNDMVVVKQ